MIYSASKRSRCLLSVCKIIKRGGVACDRTRLGRSGWQWTIKPESGSVKGAKRYYKGLRCCDIAHSAPFSQKFGSAMWNFKFILNHARLNTFANCLMGICVTFCCVAISANDAEGQCNIEIFSSESAFNFEDSFSRLKRIIFLGINCLLKYIWAYFMPQSSFCRLELFS